jgi:acyl-CoA thioester hydrolase
MSKPEISSIIKYPFPVKQNIYWGEMDAIKHINNVTYFRYFENGRVNFFFETGLWQLLIDENIQIVVAKIDCNFIQPLVFPDEIEISIGFKSIGNTSFVVHQKVESMKKGLAAHGDAIVVGTDPLTGMKKPWSEKVRAEFSKWL